MKTILDIVMQEDVEEVLLDVITYEIEKETKEFENIIMALTSEGESIPERIARQKKERMEFIEDCHKAAELLTTPTFEHSIFSPIKRVIAHVYKLLE